MSFVSISDLHIWGADDPLYSALLKLIRVRLKPGDIFVLAGDVFDLFVGDKKVFTDRYKDFFNALSEASARAVQIHYIEGNHDFQIGRAFRSIDGVQVHPEEVNFEMGGRKIYVAHGDLADKTDRGYLFLRMFFRSLPMRIFVRTAPDSWVEKIGSRSSYHSRKKKPILPAQLPTYKLERMRQCYRNYAAEKLSQGYDFVVMGHCHDLDEMSFKIGDRVGHYFNIGYPRTHGSYLSWTPGTPGEEKPIREKLIT